MLIVRIVMKIMRLDGASPPPALIVGLVQSALSQLAAQLYVYRKRAACASFLHRWKLLTRADGRLAAASVYRVLDGRRRVVEDALMYWRWYAAVEIRQALWRNAASLGIQSRLQASVLRWRRVRHTSLKPANVAFHLTACIMLLSFVHPNPKLNSNAESSP